MRDWFINSFCKDGWYDIDIKDSLFKNVATRIKVFG